MNIYEEIEKIILYGLEKGMIDNLDEILVRNKVLEALDIDTFEEVSKERKEELRNDVKKIMYPTEILDNITSWAGKNGKLKEDILVFEDLMNSKIMGQIVPRTSVISNIFWDKYKNDSKLSTEYFYELSKQSNYVRTDRIEKNISYKYKNNYGDLEITINLSKPEKDPKEIALAKNFTNGGYPLSLLCKENEGYMGRINHPGRQNHRIIKMNLTNEDWYFQYSPYIYYNEHSIVFSSEVRPMKVDKQTFRRLIEFVEIFPHYFIGSNADLPIVGGSILSHDHFQSGRHKFAMEEAEITSNVEFKGYENIKAGIVNWPLSVIRLSANLDQKEELLELSDKILQSWINYSDYENDIKAFSNDERHNTITPIARIKNSKFELDLVLRNNRTTEEFPLGIFHPHDEHHNIKKENIGLIEVMGLAVLPGRLKHEMEELNQLLMSSLTIDFVVEAMELNGDLSKHINWVKKYMSNEDLVLNDYSEKLNEFIGDTFSEVLEDCGVFKNNEVGRKGILKFISEVK